MTREIRWRITMGKVKSGQQTTTALSIRDGEDNVIFDRGHMVQLFIVDSMICCFWRGLYNFVCVGVLLTKEKVVHMTPCTTYVEKTTKTKPQHHVFLGECFSSSVWMYAFLCRNTTLVIFSKQCSNVWVLYYPVYNWVCREVE